MSREELRLGLFIIDHRAVTMGKDPLKHCQDLMCDTAGKEPKTHSRICELLKYLGQEETLVKFSDWVPPRFPVSGHKLVELGVPKGPKFAKTLNALRQIWKDSSYVLSEQELLDHVEDLKKKIT
jgi:tRNA nucleotidyltransferase (CCA-adding enzyme)